MATVERMQAALERIAAIEPTEPDDALKWEAWDEAHLRAVTEALEEAKRLAREALA